MITNNKLMNKFLSYFLRFEPIILIITVFAFWYASPIRDNWVWLIGLMLPILFVRFLLHKHIITSTSLDEYILGFIGLCLINIFISPYDTRGLILVFRPLLGVALVYFCVEYGRTHGSIRGLLNVTVLGGLLLGILALTATAWPEGKSGAYLGIITLLPSIPTYPGVEGLFNPNEIAGAITWIAPLMVGLIAYYKQSWQTMVAAFAAVLLLSSLFLGQSLSGLLGTTAGLVIVLVPRRFWHRTSGIILIGIVVVQLVILINPTFSTQIAGEITQREELNSLRHREVMWTSARQAVIDHPFTGVGMANYRSPVTWEAYPTPGYDRRAAVHAHNELLHIGTDLGIPGMMMMIAWYSVAGYMLYKCWRTNDPALQQISIALSGGLIAHMIYGLADAIPLWDRFAFVFWWMLGLAAAHYTAWRFSQPELAQNSETD